MRGVAIGFEAHPRPSGKGRRKEMKVKTPREKLMEDLNMLAKMYGSNIEEVMSSKKNRKVCYARENLVFFMYENYYSNTGWSYVKIGKLFNRHHTVIRRYIAKALARHGQSSHKLVKLEKRRYQRLLANRKRKSMENRVYG